MAVAFLGEKGQSGWWDTGFLNPTGSRYLGLVFPRTGPSATVMAAAEAACKVHDERIGRGRVAHLFRLPDDIELKIRAELAALDNASLLAFCSTEAALQSLDEIAGAAKAATTAGPTQLGALKEVTASAVLARLASTYAAGFRKATPVFPYFA